MLLEIGNTYPAESIPNPSPAELRLCWARFRYDFRRAIFEAKRSEDPDEIRDCVSDAKSARAEMRAAARIRLELRHKRPPSPATA